MRGGPARAQKPRTARLKATPAPTAGWVANRNLAQPSANGLPQGAAVLDNWFPTSQGAVLRRGKQLYATLGDGSTDTTALFTYVVGNQQQLFGATASTIYDITSVSSASNFMISTEDDEALETEGGDTLGGNSTIDQFEVYEGLTGGDWVVVQFATSGGIFLVGVNGQDDGFIYDGQTFYPNVAGGIKGLNYDGGTVAFTEGEVVTGGTSSASGTIVRVVGDETSGTLWLRDVTGTFDDDEALTDPEGGAALADGVLSDLSPGIEFPGGSALTTADLDYVWAYKNRLFFIQKDSLNAWYLPVDQIGGELALFPLGGIFQRGGSLMFGATWSLDSGSSGGLSEQCVFVTTEGEVAVYQGDDPSTADGFSKVGVYRVGRPLGHKAWIRAGGDLVIATSVGFIPLTQAIQRDYAALSPSAVSYSIEDAWNDAVALRGLEGWNCEIWPENQLVAVSPPTLDQGQPVLFVANARTGAWARYTNWRATCMAVFRGQLYFGSEGGKVFLANVTGLDEGQPYTGAYVPLFEDLGSPASLKIGNLARAVVRSRIPINELVSFQTDFDTNLPAAPSAALSESQNEWGTGIWGQSTWGTVMPELVNQSWQSIGGSGYAVATALQITSGSLAPIDAEIIRIEATYQVAEIVT